MSGEEAELGCCEVGLFLLDGEGGEEESGEDEEDYDLGTLPGVYHTAEGNRHYARDEGGN